MSPTTTAARRRTTTGKCPHCRVRFEWEGLPLLRDALCHNCLKPLKQTSRALGWPMNGEKPRTSVLLAVEWKDEDQGEGGEPIGPCRFVYYDGRHENKGWMSRKLAQAYAKKARVLFEVF